MHVVLVDDNKAVINEFKRNVKNLKEVTSKCFIFADEALEYIKTNDVDVVFLDIRLVDDNDTEGIELARKINVNSPATRIIFATDYNSYYEQANSIDVNAYSYITKPLTIEKIKAKLDKIKSEIYGVHNTTEVNMFGNFDLFVSGKQVKFRRKKSKEILAYVISKNGKIISSKDIQTDCLDEDGDSASRCVSVFIGDLKKDLRNYNIQDIFEETSNKNDKYKQYKVNTKKFKCDYYDFLNEEQYAIKKYDGSFCRDIVVDSDWNIEIENRLNVMKGI